MDVRDGLSDVLKQRSSGKTMTHRIDLDWEDSSGV